MALSVRLQNGLLGEAFIGLRQHLAAVAAAAPPAAAAELQQRHAQLLLGQLLQFAAATKPPVVSAVVRLPFGSVEEQVGGGFVGHGVSNFDMRRALAAHCMWCLSACLRAGPPWLCASSPPPLTLPPHPHPPPPPHTHHTTPHHPPKQAVVSWLEAQAAGGRAEAALMLPLFYLLRGRTPEALHAYSRLCPGAPTSQQQQELAVLLAEAARMLPAQQRALMVQRGAAPALLPASSGGAAEEGAGVPLMAGVAPVAADVAPALLSVGPSAAQAPLVGSVPAALEQQRLSAAAAADSRAAPAAAKPEARQPEAQGVQPMLFGPAATGQHGAAPVPPAAASGFGAAGFVAVDKTMQEVVPANGQAGGHEFDRVLGLATAPRQGGRSKRRFGGSAYR